MDFPNFHVVEAYRNPVVDKSLEKFSWGETDFKCIKSFAKTKLNWNPNDIQRYIEVT